MAFELERAQRTLSDQAPRAHELHLRLFIDQAPVSIAMFDREMCYLAASQRWLATFCRGDWNVIGRSCYEVMPETSQRWKDIHQRGLSGESLQEDEDQLLHFDGRTQWVRWEMRPWIGVDGKIGGVLIFAEDVSAKVSAERRLRDGEHGLQRELDAIKTIHALGMLSAQGTDLQSVLTEIVDAAIAVSNADFGTIQLLDVDSSELRIVAQRGFPQWWIEFWNSVSKGKGSCGAALERGERVIVEDVERSSIFADQRQRKAQLDAGVRAVQSTPLVSRSGTLLGMFSTHYKAPRRLDERTLRFLDLLARQASDLIEGMQTGMALRASEERYRMLFESIDQGFCTIEVMFDDQRKPIDYRFLAVNPAFERQTGIKDVVGRRMREIAPLHDEHGCQVYGEIALDGVSRRFERAAAQLNRHYDVYAWRVGEPAAHWVAVLFNDVTAHKQAQQALQLGAERLRLAMEAARMATWDWDITTGKVAWNDENFRLLGYAIGEVEPSHESWIARLHPDDRAATESALAHALRTRGEYVSEHRIVRPDGAVAWCSVRGRFVSDTDGGAMRMIGVSRDVTLRRQRQETQRVLIAELQHRTRNLLAVVRSIAQQTMKTARSPEDFGRRFDGRLQTLSRVQSFLSPVDEQPVTVGTLISIELEALRPDAARDRVTLAGPDVRLPGTLVQMLALAIHELMTNALKYGALASEGGRLGVTWRIEGTPPDVCLVLEWVERDIAPRPDGACPARRGYGRTLIEKALPYSLSAQTRFELGRDNLYCVIRLPLPREEG